MTVQLLSPAASVRRAETDSEGAEPGAEPSIDETEAHEPETEAHEAYVESEADDSGDPGWFAKGGMLLAATSALTVGVAAAATTVEDTETDALAPLEPAVAEPAPPVEGADDAGHSAIPGAPPEMLALVTTPAPEAAPVPTAAPIPAPAAAPETAETEAPAAPAAPAPEEAAAAEDPAAAEQAAPAAEDAATAPGGPAGESEPQYVQVAGAAAPASTSFSEAAETEFVALTNQARAAVGAPGVARNATLDGYARAHAAAMVEAGQIHHSDIASLLGPFSTVGENVGVGPAVGDIQAALTQSPTHYSNMVEPGFTSVGVGTLVDGAGMVWTVHVYGA